ncbi:MAG: GNAT family N-acetyltransferase [Cyanobacteria bacterium P01_F01_bin.143]
MEYGKNQKISIRVAQPEDSDAIVQLQLISIKTLCVEDYSPEQLQALLHSKNRHRYWDENIFIAEIGQLIVGFAALQKYNYVITAMFVHPQYIRRKIGTKLLRHIEQIARKKRVKKLLVYSSLTGQKFYVRNGFTPICQYNILLQQRVVFPSVKMSKKLLVTDTKKSKTKQIKNQEIKQESKIHSKFKLFIFLIMMLFLIL